MKQSHTSSSQSLRQLIGIFSEIVSTGLPALRSDQIVDTMTGVSLRRVNYKNPYTGIIYQYLTNLPASVSPGVIALLYKVRWNVEKVFDEFKNKLVETKAWASSANAKIAQATMLCITQRTVKFVRWLKNHLDLKRNWDRASAHLVKIYSKT